MLQKLASQRAKANLVLPATVFVLQAIYLALVYISEDISLLVTSVLFFLASDSLLWDKRDRIVLKTSFLSSLCGGFLFAITVWLFKELTFSDYGLHYRSFVPFVSIFSVFLIASSFSGLKQYKKELAILFCLGLPHLITSKLVPDISPLTAYFSGLLLWYSGFDVSVQGISILLPTTNIYVLEYCSGIDSITHLLGIAAIFLIMFPFKKLFYLIVPIAAVIIGFVVNAVRVVIMSLLAASGNELAFEYWHKGDGSLIFTLFSAIALCFLCQIFLSRSTVQQQ